MTIATHIARQTQTGKWSQGIAGVTLRIASTDASPLRVLAGPGTGKTYSLIRRIARLLEEGAAPDRILACTFTRTAAKDLARELAALGVKGAGKVKADTIHAFCFSILARSDVLKITDRTPRPIMEFETRFMLEDIGFGIRAGQKQLRAFSAAWARLQTDQPGWLKNREDRQFNDKLMTWLRFHEAMLIGELIPVTLEYLRNNPACPELAMFDHVLVDEYQDLNKAEQVLLDYLAGHGSLVIIGDENQSIYAFKHAHPAGIVKFPQTHAGTHDETLADCLRCPGTVVEMANSLITHATDTQHRQLNVCAQNPAGEVHLVQWRSMKEEAEGIARFIAKRVQTDQVQPGRILILAPRRQFGYAVRDALNAIQVPAHSFFSEEALEGDPKELSESQAQQAYTLLSLLVNPNDKVSLRCWCGFGSPSLRSGAWDNLVQRCRKTAENPLTLLEAIAAGQDKLSHGAELVQRLNLLKNKMQALEDLTGSQLLDALFPPSESWTEPLRALVVTIAQDDFDAPTLLKVLRVGISQPELPTDVDYVRVMSLHKSKGLTADLVVLLGCIQGLIPSVDFKTSQAEQQRQLDEQRRLFYVAITRARETLVFSNVMSIPRKLAYKMGAKVGWGRGATARTIASAFYSELGPSRPKIEMGDALLR